MLRFAPSAQASIVGVAIAAACLLAARPASARPNYMKEFVKLYLTEETSEEYAKLVKKEAKCLVCHQGKKKKNRNAYGETMVKLVEKKEKKADKIVEALKKMGKMHSDPKDEKSPTYDELIAKEMLPAGKLEDLKKEPAQEGSGKKEGSDKKE